jgi:hypothetical protein
MDNVYFRYYSHQAGSGYNVHRGSPYQEGYGIGSFLGGLFRSVLPLIKQGAKTVGKELLHAGINVAGDIIDNNKPIEEAVQARWQEAKANLKNKAQNKLNQVLEGRGLKRKKKKQIGGIRKKRKLDIFD